MITYEQLIEYLNKNKADYTEVNQPLGGKNGMSNFVFDITVEWGDWKHSHAFLRYLLGEVGYVETNCQVTEENGSDCYSAIHRFVLKQAAELFK